MVASLVVILELQKQALQQVDPRDAFLIELVSRQVLEFLVGFLTVADTDGIGLGGGPIVDRHCLIQIVSVVAPSRETLLAHFPDLVEREVFRHHNDPAEVRRRLVCGNLHS